MAPSEQRRVSSGVEFGDEARPDSDTSTSAQAVAANPEDARRTMGRDEDGRERAATAGGSPMDEDLQRGLNSGKTRNYGSCVGERADKSHDSRELQSKNQHSLANESWSPSKSFRLDDQFDRKQVLMRRFDGARDSMDDEKLRVTRKGCRPFGSFSNNGGDDFSTSESGERKTLLERAAKVIPCLGIILALCASLSLGTAGMLVKMTRSVNGIQVAILRSIIQLIIYSAIISFRKIGVLPENGEWFPVFGRAFLGATSMCFTYYALNLIPLGDATAIRFSLPIWTLIVSYFFLSEPCQLSKIVAVCVAVFGVVLIAKPEDCKFLLHLFLRLIGSESNREFQVHEQEHELAREHELESILTLDNNSLSVDMSQTNVANFTGDESTIVLQSSATLDSIKDQMATKHLQGCSLALASSILLSLSLIALRLAKKTPAEVTIFWLSLLSVLIGNIILIILKDWSLPDNLTDFLYILLNGLCGSAGQWFITSALKVEQSGIIALARTFDIEVAFLYSALLLHEDIKTTSIIGAVLVSLGVVIVVVPKWLNCSQNQSNDESSVRQEADGPQTSHILTISNNSSRNMHASSVRNVVQR